MILEILDELKQGNESLPRYFSALDKLWAENLHDIRDVDVDTIAHRLGTLQHQAEAICGSRSLGKAMMPWSAFAHFYSADHGYGDNGRAAWMLSQAFQQSMCSIEVKNGARAAAEVYHVEDFAP